MKLERFTAVVCLIIGFLAGAALAYVGVDDACPVPTPYPPPDAPPAAVNNPGMENGFTSGVANQWVGWKDSQFSGQVHYAGTDRYYSGVASQKIVLPQPSRNDGEAGIYQQLWVVPGATYTATVRIYLQFPPETYTGEDLIAWFGLDPFGQASGDGYGMVWADLLATKNQWVSRSVTVQAVLPVMTISIKATRKFPQHGDGAQAWFDAVTFTGPIPTGERPGPEPNPVDPETLIPPTIGPNLVSNGSFESAYTNGVSAGWNRWWTGSPSSPAWRRSTRVGKVGGGKYDCCCEEALANMNAKTILLYGARPSLTDPNDPGGNGTYGTVDYLKTFPNLDNTIIVGRPAVDDNAGTYLTDPVRYGRQLAEQLHLKQQEFPRIDCWQGLNEPDWGYNWQAVVAFEKAFAERCHELGMKSCSLNLSTGSPGNIWRMVDETFNPSCGDLLAVADYLGHHCYGGPSDDLMVTNQVLDNVCSFAMRPRRFKDMYARRGWRFPPVICTEGSTWGGNTHYWGDTRMAQDLTLMGDYMNANRWWCGYTNFVVGASCSWVGFEIGDHPDIMGPVSDWNYNNPADATDGLYSQMFGAGKVHPKTLAELTPAGWFNGGVNQQISGLIPGNQYLVKCCMKYEFRGFQPTQLQFYLGVDPTGQTADGSAASIDWGADQVADKAPIHEIFTHVWRTFTASGSTVSLWLRAGHPTANPSFMVYADQVELQLLDGGEPLPMIELSTHQITASALPGSPAAPQSFTVRNSGVDTLNYTVSDDADWLEVNPATGDSTGETDPIEVTFNTSGLSAGLHSATISVSAVAGNSPQTVAVDLTLEYARPDADLDGDVDQTDFGVFQGCYTGSGIAQEDPACVNTRLDADNDVDEDDFLKFRNCFTGPGVPASPGCEL